MSGTPTKENAQMVQHVVAEPAGLGLLGLAMVTLVASSQKLGWTTGVSYVLPWAIFLGAFAQLAASIYDFKRNNIFGGTAFGGYAFFWFGVAMSWMIKLGMFGKAAAETADGKQLGFAFLGYLIFSLYMTIASLETNKVLFTIFFLIDLLFIGLSLSTLTTGSLAEMGHKLAAWSELVISICSFYGSAATVINHHIGRTVLSVGKPFGILK
ncbi:MAG: acetate uptake transporter [Firmicutes bacterium]|nr:acetate uptake transporter [Bacillota bacterium]